MAEGNYPFASTYITFSVGPGMFPLPPWPMRVACERGLNMDFGVKFSGNRSAVDYTVSLGQSSSLLVPLPAVSWPRVPAWGSLEPPRRGGENAQKTGKNGKEMGEIRSKKCGRSLR